MNDRRAPPGSRNFDASLFWASADEEGEPAALRTLVRALRLADAASSSCDARQRLCAAMLLKRDARLPQTCAALTRHSALVLRVRVELELRPSAPKLLPSALEDALGFAADAPALAALLREAAYEAAQEEERNDAASEDEEAEGEEEKACVAQRLLELARRVVLAKLVDEGGRRALAKAIDEAFLCTSEPLA